MHLRLTVVTKYVARAIYAGRQYSQYHRRDNRKPSGQDGQQPLHRALALFTSLLFRLTQYIVPNEILEKLSDAWRNTPTKWYLLPVLVGALLLVALNFRKRQRQERSGNPTYVDCDDSDVVRLRAHFRCVHSARVCDLS